MAILHLRRCLNGRDHVISVYNDETQAFDQSYTNVDGTPYSFYIRERTCGQIYGSHVPEWLGKIEMMSSPVLDGTPLYMQKVGNLLYKVLADSKIPYATVEASAWTDFTVTTEKTDESQYGAKDGTGKVTLSGGSGYYGMSESSLGPWREPQLEFTNMRPNNSYVYYYRDFLDNTTHEVQFDIVEADPVTAPPQDCNVEILGIDKKMTSTELSSDGEITIFATGAENLEYSVQNSAWTSNNHFTGLSMGMVTVKVRNADFTDCTKSLNFYLDKVDVIDIQVSYGPGPSYYGRADGTVRISVGPEKFSNYSFLWSDGSTKASRIDLAAGEYSLTVTSAKSGNKATVEVTVAAGIGPWPVTIEVVRNNIYIDPQGQSLWYTWSDGVTVGSRENLPSGEYTVRIGGNLLRRDAYEEYYFLIEEGRHFFSDNIIPMRVKAQNIDLKKNLKIVGAVYLEKEYLSEDFQRVGPTSMELPADSNGEAVFKIESILRGYLEPDIPELQQVGIKRLESQFKRFYMAQEEKYGNPAVIYDMTILQYRYVLLGGLNKVEYTVDDFFDVYLPNNKPFYSWQPAQKQVFVDQPEYLTFIVNEYDISMIMVKVLLTLEDGTVVEDTLMSWPEPKRYEVFRFPAGFSQLQLSSYEVNRQVVSYQLWVEDDLGLPLTEIRTYTLNRSRTARRYFLFLNSLGGFDTLTAVGKISSQFRVETLAFERELPHDHPLTESEIYTLRKEGVQTTNVPVGYGSAEMMKAFADFALSEMVFLIQGQRLIPIDIEASPVTEDEMESLSGMEFDYRLPKDRKYTPDLSSLKPLVGEPLSVNLVSTSIVTTGGNGAIEIEVLNGTPPYTFSWSNGATTQNISNLEVGSYSVAVSDSSTPVRYGRIAKIPVTEALVQNVPVFGEGGFEEWDTASFNARHILDNSSLPEDQKALITIDSNIKRTGNNSIRVAVKPGVELTNYPFPEIRNTEGDYAAVYTVQKVDNKWKVSCWIYLPSNAILYNQPLRTWVDFTRIGISAQTDNSSDTTRTYTATANPQIRDQWQYMECIMQATNEWINEGNRTESGYRIDVGYLRKDIDTLYTTLLADGGVVYYDDFSFGVAP